MIRNTPTLVLNSRAPFGSWLLRLRAMSPITWPCADPVASESKTISPSLNQITVFRHRTRLSSYCRTALKFYAPTCISEGRSVLAPISRISIRFYSDETTCPHSVPRHAPFPHLMDEYGPAGIRRVLVRTVVGRKKSLNAGDGAQRI